MQAILDFVLTYGTDIVAVAFALHAAAVIVVNKTPSEVDNKVLAGIHRVLVLVADFIPNTKTGKVPA